MSLKTSLKTKGLAVALATTLFALTAQAQEVVLRHNLQGRALDALATLTLKFNDAQRGKAKIVLQNVAAMDAQDKNQLPHLALLDPDDEQTYFNTRPRLVPLYQVMKDAGEKLDTSAFYPQIADAVDDASGRLQALPVALALPVLFRNKDSFKKAGLDPEVAPATWMETQVVAGKLFDAGFRCPLTSIYIARMHAENVAAQHGEAVSSRSGKTEKVALNTLVNVKHLALLASWQKSFYFHYYGPRREAEDRFLSGECAMITADTTLFSRLSPTSGVHAGASELPYHDDIRDATPTKVLPDGASVWILAGKKKDEYKVAARFLKFFALPENQRDWVKATAYLPMTRSALAALKEADAFSPKLLAATEARLSVVRRDNGRLRNEDDRSRMHQILDEEIEFVWANTKPAKEALDTAMQRINANAANVNFPATGSAKKNR